MAYIIRPAAAADAEACAEIYAPYVATHVTFEYPAPDAEEMARRISGTMLQCPWLVCERDGELIGYAYAHRFRERAAFDWAVELSVYVREDSRAHGLGGTLYSALIELLHAQGYVNALGVVATPNRPSERLHEKCGFRRLFDMKDIGWKLGEWRDMAYFGLRLSSPEGEPPLPTPYPGLDAGYVERVCEKHAASLGRRSE